MDALHLRPEQPNFKTIPVQPIPMGLTQFRSVNMDAAVFKLHFRTRSIPCLGPGCPLCPLPTRLMAVLPGVAHGGTALVAYQVPCRDLAVQVSSDWRAGWLVTLVRNGKRVRLAEVGQSLHADCGDLRTSDLEASLARMWGLPSPLDYPTEDAWISASFAAIARRL